MSASGPDSNFRSWREADARQNGRAAANGHAAAYVGYANLTQARRDLGAIMARVRGVHLTDTVEGPLLLELALIGNVVRHGDGPSARQAYQRYPYMFEPVPTDEGEPAYGEHDELPERLLVTEERLELYAQAAYQFWHRIQLAYTGDR